MQTPLEISFHNMERSEAVEAKIRQRIEKLEKYFDRITSCHVFIESPPRNPRRDNRYSVHIEIRVPGDDLAVSHHPGKAGDHEDVYIAIRDSFSAMERQLKEWKRKVRGEVKTPAGSARGIQAEPPGDSS